MFDHLQDWPQRSRVKAVLYTKIFGNVISSSLSCCLYQINFGRGITHEPTEFCAVQHSWRMQIFSIKIKKSGLKSDKCFNCNCLVVMQWCLCSPVHLKTRWKIKSVNSWAIWIIFLDRLEQFGAGEHEINLKRIGHLRKVVLVSKWWHILQSSCGNGWELGLISLLEMVLQEICVCLAWLSLFPLLPLLHNFSTKWVICTRTRGLRDKKEVEGSYVSISKIQGPRAELKGEPWVWQTWGGWTSAWLLFGNPTGKQDKPHLWRMQWTLELWQLSELESCIFHPMTISVQVSQRGCSCRVYLWRDFQEMPSHNALAHVHTLFSPKRSLKALYSACAVLVISLILPICLIVVEPDHSSCTKQQEVSPSPPPSPWRAFLSQLCVMVKKVLNVAISQETEYWDVRSWRHFS